MPGPDPLIIVVRRTGGFAGMTREWRVETDDETAWGGLVESCPWDAGGDDVGVRHGPGVRDGFVWRIRITGAVDREVEVPEEALVGPFAELVGRVRAQA